MYHYTMEGAGTSGGQFVVTVGSDGKLMQVREPLFMPTSSGVPTLAGGKREELNPNVMGSKNDVYQYVVNAASSSGQYMGLMTLGPDGKLVSVRNERNDTAPTTSTAVIDFNKDPKAVLLQIHTPQHEMQHPQPQEPQNVQHQQQSNVSLQSHTQPPEQGHPQPQVPSGQGHQQPSQQQQTSAAQQQRQHQQILHPDKILKGDREVVCAKSCRACCNIDDNDESADINIYTQQNVKDDSNTSQPWAPDNSTSTFSSSIISNPPNVPPKARFQCKVCLKMFTQKVNLTTHERIHLGERPYQCKTCLKSFTQQSNLVTHERIHTGERPYQCQVCLKRFTQRQNLTAHERIHLGERPFTCQVCNKSFTQRQNLTAHERIHLGERPFQCQVCLKSFTQQQNLNSHERIHATGRQFSCSVCQKSFTQENSLSRHMQTHSGERPYTCQICHRSFAQQSSLSAHERVHSSPERRRRTYIYHGSQPTEEQQVPDQKHRTLDSQTHQIQEQKHPVEQENNNEGDNGQMQC